MLGTLCTLLLLTSSVVAQVYPSGSATPQSGQQRCAACQMEPNADLGAGCPRITGLVLLSQTHPSGKLKAAFDLQGFAQSDSQSLRAIHVHQYGVVNCSCSATGPHYNPRNVNHPLHPGDFHNFKVKRGRIVKVLSNLKAKLFGAESILGRGLVLHEGKDDMGRGGNQESLSSGNAGRRLACCTITLSNCDF
ncbi:extracellular superoxide dismutase [Cu-Zn]-like [Hypanus sabinus]|uniref:extracellular superoxide dismutase [Cu-Zn]-like n=1 Tax=Hypanus sabinus TaxID=79690 RepID=UPI0028C3DEC0|nr:extracellular superoxide dismutase [Cu-Zn]-like [Hypanus sabinus]